MEKSEKSFKKTCSRGAKVCSNFLRMGIFLAWRQIRGGSLWVNVLIITVMLFTFMNLIVVEGILVGLVEGSSRAYREDYSGDILIRPSEKEPFIEDSLNIVKKVESISEVQSVSPRIVTGGVAESNYKSRSDFNSLPEEVSVQVVGINPVAEDQTINLSGLIIEGSYLSSDEEGFVLIGSSVLDQYSADIPSFQTLEGVYVGTKIKIYVGGISKEVEVKGIVESKIGNVGQRVYFNDSMLRKIIGSPAFNFQEIAIKLKPGAKPEEVKEQIIASGINEEKILVETWKESQGEFFKNLSSTFTMLGFLIGLVGLAVSSITIFIVIFINAIVRKRYIGILKAIGICPFAIEVSYIIQSLFYAIIGSLIGLAMVYLIIKPYIDKNPIDFPFSDGILVAPIGSTFLKIIIIFIATALAALIPSRIITRKNTVDSILGR